MSKLGGMQLLSRYQSHIALACVALLAFDVAIPSFEFPAALSHALIALAAALGISRPSEVASKMAAARGLSVVLGLSAAVMAEAMPQEESSELPAPAEQSDDGGESSSSSGGESSSG